MENEEMRNGTAEERETLQEKLDEEDERDYECGMGSCRPKFMQPMANIKAFTGALSLIYIFGSMNFTYYTAVITQLEKLYGLSSTLSGFIKNIDNIGFMSTVLIFSHFCRYANKPRLFSIATAFSGLAVFIFALPHFIYGSNTYGLSDADILNNSTSKNSSNGNLDLCNVGNPIDKENGCTTRSILAPFNVGAMIFFSISEIIQGVAQAPTFSLSLTHMDDNAKKSSPFYFGIMMGMRSFAPVLGFLLGAWTTSIYVDLSDPGFGPKDPRWVGAWWLGFVICGLCTLVLAPPMAFFPPKLKTKGSDGKMHKVDGAASGYKKDSDVMENLKDMPKALWRIIKNPIMTCCIVGSCFNFYLMGFSTFTPKYLESHFGLTASTASLFTAIVGGMSYVLGPIISGSVMTKIKLSVSGSLKFMMFISITACIGFVLMGAMACDKAAWPDTLYLDGQNMTDLCNGACNCDPYVFKPVCGESDSVNYFSPCYAGCTEEVELKDGHLAYTNCTCLPGGKAMEGLCERECVMLIPYLIVMSISKFSASMTFVPFVSILMGIVHPRDKPLSLGLTMFITMIAAFPAPMIFGFVIDSACLVHQTSCTRTGACLFYDTNAFRIYHHGLAAFVKLGAFTGYTGAWLMARRRIFPPLEVEQKSTQQEHTTESKFIDETNV